MTDNIDMSSAIQSANALASAANDNLLNIGTADFLVQRQAADCPTPGELINWALRFDLQPLEAKIADLKALLKQYEEIATAKNIDVLEDNWDGMGAQVFSCRWKEFQEYLGNDTGLQKTLEAQIKSLESVRTTAEEFMKACTDEINNQLCKVRRKFVKALCRDGDLAAMAEALNAIDPLAIPKTIFGILNDFYSLNKERLEKLEEAGDKGTSIVGDLDDVSFKIDSFEAEEFTPPDKPPVGSDYNFDDQEWVSKLWCGPKPLGQRRVLEASSPST